MQLEVRPHVNILELLFVCRIALIILSKSAFLTYLMPKSLMMMVKVTSLVVCLKSLCVCYLCV